MKPKRKQRDKLVYSLIVDDIETVAENEFEIGLTTQELRLVEEKLGNRIDWYEAIASAIRDTLAETRTTET